jgi:serine-type D-Ala-D-Ala carboxypeptidase (penicillin-binding protein 5/6)
VIRAGAAALLAVALLAGCGGGGAATRTKPTSTTPAARAALQPLNGPTAPAIGPLPLAVKLATGPTPVHPNFTTRPRGGLLFDLDTGRVLWQQHPTQVLPIASLTKMMTALLAVEHLPPHASVLITRAARHAAGSKVGVLPFGKHISLQTMLYGLLLPSGNDVAIALAQRVSGTQKRFVALMNLRAQQLNLSCTHFASPSGIVDQHNHSCAVDLAALARAVLDEPRLAKVVKTFKAVRNFPIKGGKLYLFNNNPLLRTGYPGTIGVKTGYTDAAGHSFVGAAQRGGHRLGVVLLHSPNIGKQARVLLDRGFAALGVR